MSRTYRGGNDTPENDRMGWTKPSKTRRNAAIKADRAKADRLAINEGISND